MNHVRRASTRAAFAMVSSTSAAATYAIVVGTRSSSVPSVPVSTNSTSVGPSAAIVVSGRRAIVSAASATAPTASAQSRMTPGHRRDRRDARAEHRPAVVEEVADAGGGRRRWGSRSAVASPGADPDEREEGAGGAEDGGARDRPVADPAHPTDRVRDDGGDEQRADEATVGEHAPEGERGGDAHERERGRSQRRARHAQLARDRRRGSGGDAHAVPRRRRRRPEAMARFQAATQLAGSTVDHRDGPADARQRCHRR